jgi:hypothetical protein
MEGFLLSPEEGGLMKVHFRTEEEGTYLAPLVEAFLLTELPGVKVDDKEVIVDALTKILVNTRQFRLAKGPNPESLVLMRQTIRDAVEKQYPIPILTPSGPKKPGDLTIDVAELSVLRTMACLNSQVCRHHGPGISVRFRLEDQTGLYLEGPKVEQQIMEYCDTFQRLALIINKTVLHPMRETIISRRLQVPIEQMTETAKEFQPIFEEVLRGEAPVEKLWPLGWQGPLSHALRDSLDQRFQRVCPGMDKDMRIIHAAKYLANTLSRKLWKITGADEEWSPKGPIEISFAPPTPDTPITGRRMYYRTVPLKHSKRHLPFWRAKGLVRVCGEHITFMVRHWNEENEILPGWLEFEGDDGDTVKIRADVLLD